MKKKVLLIALLVALLLAPLSAASIRGTENDGAVGVGLNLGTNMGVGLKFGFGDFDVLANIGLDSFSLDGNGLGLGGDVAFSWNYYTIDGGRDLQFPLTVGAGVTSSFHFPNLQKLQITLSFYIYNLFKNLSSFKILVILFYLVIYYSLLFFIHTISHTILLAGAAVAKRVARSVGKHCVCVCVWRGVM